MQILAKDCCGSVKYKSIRSAICQIILEYRYNRSAIDSTHSAIDSTHSAIDSTRVSQLQNGCGSQIIKNIN